MRLIKALAIERFVFASRYIAFQFALSIFSIAVASGFVFLVWYAGGWAEMFEVARVFLATVFVDLFCSLFLPLAVARPDKGKNELAIDIIAVTLIKCAIFLFGIYAIYNNRPVALVFERDRFFVVTLNEIDKTLIKSLPQNLTPSPLAQVFNVGLRDPVSLQEYVESINLSMQGFTQAMRPNWWRAYDVVDKSMARAKSSSMAALIATTRSKKLEMDVSKTNIPLEQLRYLPLTSSKKSEWIIIMDDAGNTLASVRME